MIQTFDLNLATDTLESDASSLNATIESLQQIEVRASIEITQSPNPSLLLSFSVKLPNKSLAEQLDWPDWHSQNVSCKDYLWERTCLECFITGIEQPQISSYIEINASPSGHYALYDFIGYRNPAGLPPVPLMQRDATSHACINWQGTGATDDANLRQRKFAIDLAQLPKSMFDGKNVTIKRFNLSVILYFADTALYFAPIHATPPDFHHQNYWLDFTAH